MELNYNNLQVTKKLLDTCPKDIIEDFLMDRANIRGIQHTFDPIDYKDNAIFRDLHIDRLNIRFIKDILEAHPSTTRYEPSVCTIEEPYIIYKDFKYEITDRVRMLLGMATKEEVMSMLLRYASMVSSDLQRVIPAEKALALYEDGYKYEGFASPLNSILLPLGGRYCSLFPDTDVPFGSLGAFDTEKVLKNRDGHWIIHPPQTPHMVWYSFNSIVLALVRHRASNMRAHFLTTGHLGGLLQHPIIRSRNTLLKYRHYYEDINKKKIISLEDSIEFNVSHQSNRHY